MEMRLTERSQQFTNLAVITPCRPRALQGSNSFLQHRLGFCQLACCEKLNQYQHTVACKSQTVDSTLFEQKNHHPIWFNCNFLLSVSLISNTSLAPFRGPIQKLNGC